MALPTVQKTWQISANNRLTSADDLVMYRKSLRSVKDVLKSFAQGALQVVACSDSTVVPDYWDGVDRWDSDGDLVWAGAGNPHSWIILERTDGVQVAFDCNETFANEMFIGFSPGGLYTGGDNTVRPTASDECTSLQFAHTGSATDRWIADYSDYSGDIVFHVWCSTDGSIQRIAWFRNGWNVAFWRFETWQDAPTGLLIPTFGSVRVYQTTPPSADCTAPVQMHSHQQGQFYANSLVANFYTSSFDGGSTYGDVWPSTDYGEVPNELDNTLTLSELACLSSTVGARGWKGRCVDVWLTSWAARQNGYTFPADPLARNFVCVGALVLPWFGDCTGMLVA